MSEHQTTFDTPHNEAFRALGALEPGQQWSAFDVPRNHARAGKAARFVTTVWNFHWVDNTGNRTVTERAIARDETDGTLWYRIPKPPAGAKKTWVAHWSGLELALSNGIPIVGVLKDVHSSRCSLKHIFDCGNPRREVDGSAMWLQLRPRGQVGCEVRPIGIRQVTTQPSEASPPVQVSRRVERADPNSGKRAAANAGWRLASTSAKATLAGMVAIPVMVMGAAAGSGTVFWIGAVIAAMAFLTFVMILLGVSLGALWKLANFR